MTCKTRVIEIWDETGYLFPNIWQFTIDICIESRLDTTSAIAML